MAISHPNHSSGNSSSSSNFLLSFSTGKSSSGSSSKSMASRSSRLHRHRKRHPRVLLLSAASGGSLNSNNSRNTNHNDQDADGANPFRCFSSIIVRLCFGLFLFFGVVLTNHMLWNDSLQDYIPESDGNLAAFPLSLLSALQSGGQDVAPEENEQEEEEENPVLAQSFSNPTEVKKTKQLRTGNADKKEQKEKKKKQQKTQKESTKKESAIEQQPPKQVLDASSESSMATPSVTSKRINVFYHTFSGPTAENAKLTRKIVSTQLRVLKTAMTENRDDLTWSLRYGSVGKKGVVTEDLVNGQCSKIPGLDCQYLGHANSGHEEATLQKMRNFCQANPKDVVVYIHTKGSLHETDFNQKWRKPLTQGALRPTCLNRLMDFDQSEMENFNETTVCNTCGLQLYPLWNIMYPGNMFSARCDYVAKLADLNEFNTQMSTIVNMTLTDTKMWTHELYDQHFEEDREGVLGTGRYSNEQWIGSHGAVRPCDLMGQYTNLYPMARGLQRRPHFLPGATARRAPRVPLQRGNWYRFDENMFTTAARKDAKTMRPYQYYLLPGMLFRFWHVNREFPPDYSWIWDYYPNGDKWKAKIQDALEEVSSSGEEPGSPSYLIKVSKLIW